jgi:hypothetical protein
LLVCFGSSVPCSWHGGNDISVVGIGSASYHMLSW